MRETRTVITTSCDRPRCGRVISEEEQDVDAPPDGKEPDLVVKRAGKPDIVYPDVCDICTKAIDGYVLGIEKKPRKKEAEPAAPVEPVDPGEGLTDEERRAISVVIGGNDSPASDEEIAHHGYDLAGLPDDLKAYREEQASDR